MELTYEYNFEWYYGGANVRCLCGAANCSLFLGAKCRRFREYNHVWEDGDDRYIVDDLPVYDLTDDESTPVISGTSGGNEHTKILNDGEGSTFMLEPTNSATKKKSQRKPKMKVGNMGKEQARPIRPQLNVTSVKKLLMAESFVTNNTLLVLAGTSYGVNNARML
ncbi:hypothetical protein R3W88_019044 [Solanum pinnatisectum]|uniref:Post-SET domain-containing protein n=1 Tax=Solanum pinnatisectum TaxID=50273 RepID=A0AAV9KIE5_9SOLN|nr:hypothetical protein R3W88_019044 [Solanum pinnatisectum]